MNRTARRSRPKPASAKAEPTADAKKAAGGKKEDLQLNAALNHLKGLPIKATSAAVAAAK